MSDDDPAFVDDIARSMDKNIPPHQRHAAEKRIWSRVRQNGQPTGIGGPFHHKRKKPASWGD